MAKQEKPQLTLSSSRSFWEWLTEQVNRDDSIGIFSRAMRRYGQNGKLDNDAIEPVQHQVVKLTEGMEQALKQWQEEPLKDSLQDYSAKTEDGAITVYCRQLRNHVIKHIAEADLVVGCMPWLTNPAILEALQTRWGISLLVRKEKFWDFTSEESQNLRPMYEKFPADLRFSDSWLSSFLPSQLGKRDEFIEPIRYVPLRLHHKFLILFRIPSVHSFSLPFSTEGIYPYAVWTGSFKFTAASEQSVDTAILLTDPTIVRAYLYEYGQILAVSESIPLLHFPKRE